MRPHAPVPDLSVPPDHRGVRWCTCGRPMSNRTAHPDDAPTDLDLYRRRLGDRDEQEQP